MPHKLTKARFCHYHAWSTFSQQHKNEAYLHYIVTCDEKWVSVQKPETCWAVVRQGWSTISKPELHPYEVLLTT